MLNSVIGTQQLLLASCSQDALAGLPKLMTFNMLRLKAIEPVASVAKTPVTSTSLEHTIITFGVREPSITIHLVKKKARNQKGTVKKRWKPKMVVTDRKMC